MTELDQELIVHAIFAGGYAGAPIMGGTGGVSEDSLRFNDLNASQLRVNKTCFPKARAEAACLPFCPNAWPFSGQSIPCSRMRSRRLLCRTSKVPASSMETTGQVKSAKDKYGKRTQNARSNDSSQYLTSWFYFLVGPQASRITCSINLNTATYILPHDSGILMTGHP